MDCSVTLTVLDLAVRKKTASMNFTGFEIKQTSRNCDINVLCVRNLGIVGSQTQLSLRCNYVLKNNYMFRPMMAIVRLPCEYLRTYCKLYRAHNVEISTCLVSKV